MENGRTSDKVFNEIKEKIISGEWTKGTKIMSEPQLAKELGVSRVSVREAIEKMVALSILSKKRGGGTFVNDLGATMYLNSLLPMITLDVTDYLDILEFRLIVEVESARLCAIRCEDFILKELEECYEAMIASKDDMEVFTHKDLDFHIKIVEGSGNPLVVKVYELLRDLLAYHQKSLYKSLGPLGGIKEHKYILDAIKNRDSELAAIFIRRHIERTIAELKSEKNS